MISPFVHGVADYFEKTSETNTINKILSGISLTPVLPLAFDTIINQVMPAGKKFRSIGGFLTGNGLGIFRIEIDDVIVFQERNSYFQRNVIFPENFMLYANQRLIVSCQNVTISQQTNSYEAYLFFREELI